jgi:hypothetical protein
MREARTSATVIGSRIIHVGPRDQGVKAGHGSPELRLELRMAGRRLDFLGLLARQSAAQ